MEQDVLLLDNDQPLDVEAVDSHSGTEPVGVSPARSPFRLLWIALGTVAVNLVFATGLYLTAKPGAAPLPVTAEYQTDPFANTTLDQSNKPAPVGDGSDAGPRSRLVAQLPAKLHPVLEVRMPTASEQEAAMPSATLPELPRSSVRSIGRQGVPTLPRSSEAPASRSAAQAAADAAANGTTSGIVSTRPVK